MINTFWRRNNRPDPSLRDRALNDPEADERDLALRELAERWPEHADTLGALLDRSSTTAATTCEGRF